ncbi:putative cyclin-dependent protein kinase inhibitor SMR1 [Cocos nucifera]|uniref:Putative cyclin-dependent protein kinase inhibitor SMR1 n=1 Tax=Cocos nucifera TaxID=13894 RepID=A0A8K0IJ88_COCNU|nr:putative cyclin-dependent protein kinase inhibitor SMR1 [Cocos nucifera]
MGPTPFQSDGCTPPVPFPIRMALLKAPKVLTMSASSELTCVTSEFVLRPVLTVRSAEDCGENHHGDECRTPTSKESKLPSIPGSCPPAPPRKPRRVVSCKRRLVEELEVIMVGAEELERLFRRRDEPNVIASGRHAKKRRRRHADDK